MAAVNYRLSRARNRSYPLAWTLILSILLALLGGRSTQGFAAGDSPQTWVFPIDHLKDDHYRYYQALLVQALAAQGIRLQFVVQGEVSQPRMMRDLEKGRTAIRPMLPTARRDCLLTQVPVDLTDGRIGERVLLIRPSESERFKQVQTVDQLRATGAVAALGAHWFDISVWRANQLPYRVQSGDWSHIYDMLRVGGRGIDYFPRGVNEVLSEAEQHPGLMIEPHLLLTYNRDFRFYVSAPYAKDVPAITRALRQAQASGLMARLRREYWGNLAQALDLPGRQRINLFTPPLPTAQSSARPDCNNSVRRPDDTGLLKK